jgi:hypothetical protein
MPDWTTDEILAVHFRMHKAEGVLFQSALVRAAEKCKLNTLPVLENIGFLSQHNGPVVIISSRRQKTANYSITIHT